MKSTYRFGAASAAMIAALTLVSPAHAAPETEEATARAEIVQALTVENTAALDFGSIALSNTAGTVVVGSDGSLISCGATCYSTTSAASFDVTGSAGKTVTVQLPTTALTLTHTTAPDTLEVSSFTTSATAGELVLDVDGEGTFTVGGTLAFDGDEVEGTYSAQFEVDVDYQ